MAEPVIPPLPAGFKLDSAPAVPPLPAGFKLDQPAAPKQDLPFGLETDPGVAMGEATLSMGSGMASSALGGLAGLATGNPDITRRIQAAGTYEPRTKGGQMLTGAVAAPFEALAGVADKAGGKVTDITGSPALGAATNTGIQALPMLVGKVMPKGAAMLKPAPNAPLAAASKSGLSILPEEAKAGIVNRNIASISDEPKLAQDISRKNNPVLADKITTDLGLPKGTELDLPTIRTVRKDAYKAWEPIRKVGDIETDAKYVAEANAVADQYRSASRSFPKMEKADVEKIVDGIKVKKFDAGDAVDMIKTLREDASEAFAKGDARMGHANKRAAQAIEDQIDRHIQAEVAGSEYGAPKTGWTNIMKDFKEGRITAAKTFAAEKALGPNGTINPQVYARELKKNPDKFTGGAKEVAEFARDFPRSSLKPSTTPTGMNAMDIAAAMFTKEGMLPFVRPAARSVMASGPYQSAFIRNPGALMRALGSPAAEGALPMAGAQGMTGARSLEEILRQASMPQGGQFPTPRGAPSGRIGGGSK